MSLTLKELEAVARELSRDLEGGRLTSVALADDHSIFLTIDTDDREFKVLLCTRPRASRFHVTTHPPRRAPEPGRANPLIRAIGDMQDATVDRVSTRYNDRVATLALSSGDERRTILFECSGHHANLFLLDEDDVILARLKPSQSHKRRLLVGRRYERPLYHKGDNMQSLRFLGASGSISADVEAHYELEAKRAFLTRRVAGLRRRLKSALDYYTRLSNAIQGDIERQKEAAGTLKARSVPDHGRMRAKRLTRAGSACRARLKRVDENVARLSSALERLMQGGEHAVQSAEDTLKSLPPRPR